MSYSDFKLSDIKGQFNLTVLEEVGTFSQIPPLDNVSSLIREIIHRNFSLALAINTEKSRSEMIIFPLLIELRTLFNDKISLFSGNDFTVDGSIGLSGICDYIISRSSEQLSVEAPVTIIFEAKKENLNEGIPQCLAAMVAATIFNDRRNNPISPIYGAVKMGNLWKFLKLDGDTVTIDLYEYYVMPLETILGILSFMVRVAINE